MGNITIQGDITAGVPGGAIGGASSVASGQVLYGTAAGVAGTSANLSFSNAASRLTVGNASAADNAGILTQGSGTIRWQAAPGGGGAFVIQNNSNTGVFFQNSSSTLALLANSGNLLLGTTTDNNFRVDIASSGASGTLRAYDQTPTTGVTQLIVRAGAGQSSTNLQTWQNAAGTLLASVTSAGTLNAQSGLAFAGFISDNNGFLGLYGNAPPIANMSVFLGSARLLAWSPATTVGGSADLSLSRASANTLQVGDGGSNALGALNFRSGTVYDSTATTGATTFVVRAGAGQSTTNLQTWQDSSGSTAIFASISSGASSFFVRGANATRSAYFGDSGVVAGSAGRFTWSSNTPDNAADLSLSRASANTLQVGDGGSNANGIVSAASYRAPLTTPASATATGTAGTIVWDANYVYVCTATNTWKRAAIATW